MVMDPVLFLGVVTVLAAGLAFYFMRKRRVKLAESVIGVMLIFVVVFVIPFLGLIKVLPKESFLLGPDQEIRGMFPKKAQLWRWDSQLSGASVVSYAAEETKVFMEVKPITDNPKVRDVRYTVIVKAFGTPEKVLAVQQWLAENNSHQNVKDFLEFWLYEFNEKHSQDLAVFYNPKDAKQQCLFFRLVAGFFKPHLKGSGVTLKSARFRLL